MGSSGARATTVGATATAEIVDVLTPLGGLRSRAMFGGHGIFRDDLMFAIVDSEGRVYLRADDTTAPSFETAGCSRHPRMPYWEIPGRIRDDPEQLREWAKVAADVAARSRR